MTKAKDELTTQSDNTLDIDFSDVVQLIRGSVPGGMGYAKVAKILDKAIQPQIAAQNLALLTRLEAELIEEGEIAISQADVLEVLQSERALIEKRMM